jgi:hypothetical protein
MTRRPSDEAIFRHHALGWNDVMVARKLGCSPTVVWKTRRRLGLKSNYRSPASRKDHRKRLVMAARRIGLDRFRDIHMHRERLRAAADGWPAGTTRRAADVLAAVERSGGCTCQALGAALGLCGSISFRWLARLGREGWIVSDGGRPRRWSLAPEVAARRAAKRGAAA